MVKFYTETDHTMHYSKKGRQYILADKILYFSLKLNKRNKINK